MFHWFKDSFAPYRIPRTWMSSVRVDLVLSEQQARVTVVNCDIIFHCFLPSLLAHDLKNYFTGEAYIPISLISGTCEVLANRRWADVKHTMSNQVLKALSALVLCMYVFILFTKRMAGPKKGLLLQSRFQNEQEKCSKAYSVCNLQRYHET